MPIVKKKSDNECLSGHWKGVNFDIFFVKNKKVLHYNDVYKLWAHGL